MGLTGHKRHVTFIVNPKAGIQGTSSFAHQVGRHLDTSKFNHSIHYTQHAGHGFELAREAVKTGVDVVAAVGGDGTMNECASALVEANPVLSLVPMGSGNGLARDLGIPRNVAKSISVINSFHTKAIDCGIINGSHFFCTAGVGFDAEVSKQFQWQKTRGFTGYLKTAFRELWRYHSTTYRMQFDNRELEKQAFSITLANACQFGNNAIISPEADPGDGFLDLCIIREFPKIQSPLLLKQLFSGSIHRSQYSEIYKVKQARIICPPECVYHLDGETRVLDGDVLNIETVPGALRILVP